MGQIARNLTDAVDGLLKGTRYLIHDRDPLFTAEFLSTLAEGGTESVKLPPRPPNLNSYAKRFVRTIKESCLQRMVLFGEDALRTAIRAFVAHYHGERNHQASAICSSSLIPVSPTGADRSDAASADCSTTMTGPPDNVRAFQFLDITRSRSLIPPLDEMEEAVCGPRRTGASRVMATATRSPLS
jgi:hypothetical protein